MTKTGLLLINLGTPDHCDRRSVYRYLKEFLNDRRVIDLPQPFRFILTNFFIVPFRASASARLYEKIWMTEGSPLLLHSLALKEAMQAELGETIKVAFGMRYGRPSISSALDELKDCEKITIIPLFPQYSSAATGSALQETFEILAKRWNIPSIKVINEFYAHPAFIKSYGHVVKKALIGKSVDTVLFSYHGLPERHLNKSECMAACDHLHECPKISSTNAYCYRAQCFVSSDLIAKEVGLSREQYHVAFQSRLGRTPWLKPYTDLLLPELIGKGCKNIAVLSPSFVADCLETLEEINIRLREQWRSLGGGEFYFIHCLNSEQEWVKGLGEMLLSA